ncbi:MAG TPA: glycoside hydrolase family 3 C-terminal domain-containing protein [Terriglobia bacterium]|nr:glycoside hydrolase family 3 C-terminal domain-containing protein [Terriglobia bacterium]
MRARIICRSFIAVVVLGWAVGVLPPVPAQAQTNTGQPWMNQSLSARRRANLLIRAMTLKDKVGLVHGVDRKEHPFKGYVGYVPANPRLHIPALKLADGRAGVGNKAAGVTLLPAPIAAAASWDTSLLETFGQVIGKEQWGKGTNVELGPTIDVVRIPQWGRTFETYGEDPYLNSQMAAAEIKGIQSQGPIANANMYLTMNQESDRFKIDSVVDERTLQEIYLPPFQAAVSSGVGTFMCAYIKTNGVYSCESSHVLGDLLKKQLGFGGWVMSDWGGTHSTVASAEAGLDQEMPDDRYYGKALETAVTSGQVSMATLDEHVRRILVTMFRHGLFDKPQPGDWDSNVRSPEHDAFSRRVAEQGIVLLKNEGNILPLSVGSSIAVIGADGGTKPQVEGGGSSHVVPPYVVSPLDGIRKRLGEGGHVTYSDGSDLASATSVAKSAAVAIVFVSTVEGEGHDRPDLELPGKQDELISTVAAANPKTIVVLNTGGPVLMPWVDHVRGVIEAWYPGQEDGNAIAAVLFGDINPAGKLTLTFPRTADKIPTSTQQQWPGVNGKSIYSEKLNVGYRWYDATGTDPLFPFGFGLSYTTFRLSNFVITPTMLSKSPANIYGTVDVTNTGHRDGAEVVQAYISQPSSNREPPRQLCAFAKVFLKPGETRQVRLTIEPRALSYYDISTRRWTSAPGTYQLLVGTSSRDLPLHRDITITDGSNR